MHVAGIHSVPVCNYDYNIAHLVQYPYKLAQVRLKLLLPVHSSDTRTNMHNIAHKYYLTDSLVSQHLVLFHVI